MYWQTVARKNMNAVRHFHYENALHLFYNTDLAEEHKRSQWILP